MPYTILVLHRSHLLCQTHKAVIALLYLKDERMLDTIEKRFWCPKELPKDYLKSAAVAAIKWQNGVINPIIAKLSSTKAPNAFLSFPLGYE